MRPTKITRPDFDEEVFEKTWEKADFRQRLDMLNRITPQKSKLLAETIPQLLSGETNPNVAASLIKVFYTYWPHKRLEPLFTRLGARQVSLRTAALEALIYLAPAKLAKCLPELLKAANSRIRVLAVQGLAKIDMAEAVRHLERLLLQGNTSQKRVGLQCVILLPFEQIRTLLLKVFAAEGDQFFLEKVGMIFQTNPDPEVPFKLWEIEEISSKQKAETTEKIRERVLQIIEKSGILEEKFSEYLKRLHDWINRRSTLRAIQEALARFSSGEIMDAKGLAEHLHNHRWMPEFPQIVKTAISWPVPEQFRELLRTLLNPSILKPREIDGIEWSDSFSDSEKIRFLSRVRPPNLDKFVPILKGILGSQGGKTAISIAALRAANRLRIPEFCETAKKLAGSPEVGLAFTALDYLSAFKPAATLPNLVDMVKGGETRQKTAAFRVLNHNFPKKALEMVLDLLEAPDHESHEIAMNGIAFLDISLTRDGLTSFLERNPDTSLFEKCLFLFQSNPEFENLYSLYKIEKFAPSQILERVKSTRKRNEEYLIRFGRLKSDLLPEFEIEFSRMWQREQERANNLPEYSLEALEETS